ncbi:MAG: cytochrome b [Legionellaceae bacterium]
MKNFGSWFDERFAWRKAWRSFALDYYVPKNLNLYYVFGSLALLVLLNQVVTGVWLTFFYTPTAQHAFDSIQLIMRDVPYGWLLRTMHSTGASLFFAVLYVHVFRGLLYGSYQKPRELVWFLGVVLFVLMIVETFFGYLLPWGQLSYWGAQVITSLLGLIPYVGETFVLWIRGDYGVSGVTLHRFFTLHVIVVPLILCVFVVLHLVALRKVGSNNPDGIDIYLHLDQRGNPYDGIPFHPYYTLSDALAVLGFLMVFFSIVFFFPTFGGYFLDPTNLEPANPYITPAHINPLWYMAPFYAMLRAVPYPFLGVMVMLSSVAFLFFMPCLDRSPVRSMRYKGYASKITLCLFVVSFLVLGVLGTLDVTAPRLEMARVSMVLYFSYFFLMPWITRYELHKDTPQRISS